MSAHSAECESNAQDTSLCPSAYSLHVNEERKGAFKCQPPRKERERSYLDFEDLLPKLIGSLMRQGGCARNTFLVGSVKNSQNAKAWNVMCTGSRLPARVSC